MCKGVCVCVRLCVCIASQFQQHLHNRTHMLQNTYKSRRRQTAAAERKTAPAPSAQTDRHEEESKETDTCSIASRLRRGRVCNEVEQQWHSTQLRRPHSHRVNILIHQKQVPQQSRSVGSRCVGRHSSCCCQSHCQLHLRIPSKRTHSSKRAHSKRSLPAALAHTLLRCFCWAWALCCQRLCTPRSASCHTFSNVSARVLYLLCKTHSTEDFGENAGLLAPLIMYHFSTE